MFLRRLAALGFQSNIHPPRSKRDEPKKRVFKQFKPIAKEVVADGKKRECHEGDDNTDEIP